MLELGRGRLAKMRVQLGGPAQYGLPLDDACVPLNPLIGQRLRLEYLGAIHCIHCGRRTNKSFSQGYCYPCFKKLPQCDLCIVSPEKCHHALGTCRDPQWGEDFCMSDHVVYLANSSGIKVGITRATQLPTRWLDQGASQALPILRVATRQQSGLVEDLLRSQVADRTNWRALLKGDAEPQDLPAMRENLFEQCGEGIVALQQRFGLQAIQPLPAAEVLEIRYPVEAYPTKIASLDLEKTPVIEGVLRGIKGQYLILDCGVINIRKYTAYQLAISCKPQAAS
ncbi:DUF2797 domain-containing protein [Stutzerimonas kirkiae]|uniref:DUF2797 domain-containing protein n=1 Tax=Stutzerimonas kirkiae TaxID=2211392 RepID=A0A4V6MX85_9GAMM|nr:DUF2797 domain-containing protein [Stutzerimonas kirkiae]TBU91285.1 DUF2797 domain-containing protein [Stutzerimonas kirkiae]TBV00445.1 DUF2797 domain-containing protein [Stutzerimonas kirkiae]TBV11811.1 DUF2797 domain-containing protein [Stutzerimonas kirkiae]TBV15263.1 DUF2797 domain-containing protein [Stutzerimonas kirkiae]